MRRTVGLMLMVCAVAHAAVFPKPREIQLSDQTLALSENVPILLPEQATAEDGFLARFLLAE